MPLWPFRSHDPAPFMPGEPEKKKEDPPQYVSQATFQQALDDVKGMNSKLDQMAGMFTGWAQAQPNQPPAQQVQQEQAVPDITDQEYESACLSGDHIKIGVRMNAISERKAREVRKEYDRRFQVLEQQGMTILDRVSTEAGQSALTSLPYYQLFKADIDAALKNIPAHQRTPEMRTHIYHATVGGNLDKVKAHDATEAVRIGKEREQLDTPGRRAQDISQGPTPENVFGDVLLKPDATWRGGAKLWDRRSPDTWAQTRYGVKDMKEAAVYASNVLALDDCPRCFGPVINGKCHCRGRIA